MTHELLQFFKFEHLPPKLQDASKPFCRLAENIFSTKSEAFSEVVPRLISKVLMDVTDKCPRTTEIRWCVSKLETASVLAETETQLPGTTTLDLVLRFVLEAKDCAVRAVLYVPPAQEKQPCTWCSGTGFVDVTPCHECKGTGQAI
jgi:hypothetical protein